MPMKPTIILILLVLLITGCAQQKDTAIIKITTIAEYGKSLDWCHTNDMIAFGKLGDDSYYDVYIMNADGSHEKCLTCTGGCPQKHNGNPVWHPSGEYIVFTAQNEDAIGDLYDITAKPGRGVNCNLWATSNEGTTFWQLTYYETRLTDARGVIHPQFSHDGKKLFWAERLLDKEGTPWGEWALQVADFVIGENGCSLQNIKTYQPGESLRFYETHAFSSDGTKVLFSGNLVPDQLESGLDIYELNLETGDILRLTDTFYEWDEHAHYSPDEKKIAWMSSTDLGDLGITFDDLKHHIWGLKLKTELWIMDRDGSNKQRLTYFNAPGHPEYMGKVIVSDSSWSPDGSAIAITIAYWVGPDVNDYSSKILLIEINPQVLSQSYVYPRGWGRIPLTFIPLTLLTIKFVPR